MSAGQFLSAIYQGDDGSSFYAVRVQPETVQCVLNGFTNFSQPGPVNRAVRALVRGSKRRRGVICRSVGVKFTGAVPDGYQGDSILYIPVMSHFRWRQINPTANLPGTYLDLPVVIVSKQPEYIN